VDLAKEAFQLVGRGANGHSTRSLTGNLAIQQTERDRPNFERLRPSRTLLTTRSSSDSVQTCPVFARSHSLLWPSRNHR